MDSNRVLIQKEFEKHKGEFVISHGKVYRLIGIVDGVDDYYWLFHDRRRIFQATCVGYFTPLYGLIDDRHYNDMINSARWNDVDLMLEKVKEEDRDKLEHKTKEGIRAELIKESFDEKDELISDIYWEIKEL